MNRIVGGKIALWMRQITLAVHHGIKIETMNMGNPKRR